MPCFVLLFMYYLLYVVFHFARLYLVFFFFFFFQAEDGIRDYKVTGVQTCALPIWRPWAGAAGAGCAPRSDRPAASSGRCVGCAQRPRRRRRSCTTRSRSSRREIGRASCRERV